MTDTCLITKSHKFLWWKWHDREYDHEWEYEDKETRICAICGKKEMYFGYNYYAGVRSEDWRPVRLYKEQ